MIESILADLAEIPLLPTVPDEGGEGEGEGEGGGGGEGEVGAAGGSGGEAAEMVAMEVWTEAGVPNPWP